jgi:hypothetical protein
MENVEFVHFFQAQNSIFQYFKDLRLT